MSGLVWKGGMTYQAGSPARGSFSAPMSVELVEALQMLMALHLPFDPGLPMPMTHPPVYIKRLDIRVETLDANFYGSAPGNMVFGRVVEIEVQSEP